MATTNRILSIDIMRGLTLFLMLFVNDLYSPGVPKWLVHTAALEDGMGLADWVFPGFLFMVGLSIPFAFMSRERKNPSNKNLIFHILIRTISLLLIGFFMVNMENYNQDLTGINKFVWSILVYTSIFFIWNNYPNESKFKIIYTVLKCVGILSLFILAIVYRSGDFENVGWMSTSWWGILGLIGWGYFVSAITYFFLKDRLLYILLVWILFVLLNILAQTSFLNFLNPIKPIFGVIIDGNVPSIVLSGLLIGTLLKKYRKNQKQYLMLIISIGIVSLMIAFILRNWFIISKIIGTPSWAMLCNGISILLFAFLYYIIDLKKWQKWTIPFLPAGRNSLTTYLAPDILYFIIWGCNLNILFYKQIEMPWLAVSGSIIWAFLMIGFGALLSKINIRLKL
tara:strand:- start:3510 stop:4697 length:1188 start_codon:yes stop_codon:yes gene_type:complete